MIKQILKKLAYISARFCGFSDIATTRGDPRLALLNDKPNWTKIKAKA